MKSSSRRALRRAVELPCELVTRHVDEPLLYWATDLTPYGLWLQTRFPMQLGDEAVVCFRPHVLWPNRELMVFARVSRVHGARDPEARGMALEFLDLTTHELRTLIAWLRHRPPPLPKRRARTASRHSLPRPRYLAA